MSEISLYQEQIDGLLRNKEYDELRSELLEHSHLPGPQANLSMAKAFANCFQDDEIVDQCLCLLKEWMTIDCDGNVPEIMLPFCAIQALGFCYFQCQDTEIKQLLQSAMKDPRWRMREGVALALQHLGECDEQALISFIKEQYPSSSYYEKRAFVAALAHPDILKKSEHLTRFALELSDQILHDVYDSTLDSKRDDVIALNKGLSYALSVFVLYLPEVGFSYMNQWAGINHIQVQRILKENLRKNRIRKPFLKECETLEIQLKTKR